MGEKENDKYLRILKGNFINQTIMKEKVYLRRTGKKHLEAKLYSRNLIKAINTYEGNLMI